PKSVASSSLRASTKAVCRLPSRRVGVARASALSFAASSNRFCSGRPHKAANPRPHRLTGAQTLDPTLINVHPKFVAGEARKNVCGRLAVLAEAGEGLVGLFFRQIEFVAQMCLDGRNCRGKVSFQLLGSGSAQECRTIATTSKPQFLLPAVETGRASFDFVA